MLDNTSGDEAPADRSAEDPSQEEPEPRAHRLHKNPPGEIDLLVDYQTEVLNKLDGVTSVTERKDRPTLLLIARHIPRSIIHAALEATQDARLRSLDGEHARITPAAYFVAGVKTRCATVGIQSPFGRASPATAAAM